MNFGTGKTHYMILTNCVGRLLLLLCLFLFKKGSSGAVNHRNCLVLMTVSDRNLRLQKVLSFIFKHFQPELVDKLAQIGLKDIIGKSNWERAQDDHERSQRQEIRRGLKL